MSTTNHGFVSRVHGPQQDYGNWHNMGQLSLPIAHQRGMLSSEKSITAMFVVVFFFNRIQL